MMKVIPINCGYYNYKSINEEQFPTRITEDIFDNFPSNCDRLEYEGQKYLVGTGQINIDIDKTQSEFTKICVLNMLARFTDKMETFKVALTTPPLMFPSQKDELPRYLEGEYLVIHNGKPKAITIQEVKVFPETLTAYIANNTNGKYNNKDVLVLDIGGLTTNGCLIKRGGIFTLDDMFTIKNGMYHLDDEICRYLNSKYYLSVDIDDINTFREEGLHINGNKEDIMMEEILVIDKIYKKFIAEIKKAIDLRKWSTEVYNVLITGGGGKVLYNTLRYELVPHAELGKNPLFDNVNGLSELAKRVFR